MTEKEKTAACPDIKPGDRVAVKEGVVHLGGRTGVVRTVGDGHPLNVTVDVGNAPARVVEIGLNKLEIERL